MKDVYKDLYIETNGTKLHVHAYDKNGPAVLFIHYSSGVIPDWNAVIPAFLDHYYVVVPEMRGHGLSDKPAQGNTLEGMARDVIGLMDAMGIEQAHIVGSSLGSDIGVVAAAIEPNRILSLTLEGPPQNAFGEYGMYDVPDEGIEDKKDELRAIRAARKITCYSSKEEMLAERKKQFEEAGQWNETIAASFTYNVRQTEEGTYTTTMPPYVMNEFMEDFWDTRFEQYFDRITCPVLFLPSEDEMNSESMQRYLQRVRMNLQHSKIVSIPGSFHTGPMFFQPDEMSQEILKFYSDITTIVSR